MTEILRYKGEPKTKPLKGKDKIEENIKINVPDLKYELFDVAEEKLKETVKGSVVVTKKGLGEVVISQDYNYKDGTLYVNLKTVNIKGTGATYIPKIEGLPVDQVKSLLGRYNIKLQSHGTGNIVYQETEPGEYSKKIKKLTVWCN